MDPRAGFGPCGQQLNFWPLFETETHFLGHPVGGSILIPSTLLWFLNVMSSLGKQVVTFECRRKGLGQCRVSNLILYLNCNNKFSYNFINIITFHRKTSLHSMILYTLALIELMMVM